MACFPLARSSFSPAVALRCGLPPRRPASVIRCRADERNGSSGGKEAPESLFMKELKRRGMTPTTSLLEETMEEAVEEEMMMRDRTRRRGAVSSPEYDEGVANQRERSMSLNSEGLEGLIPRAKLLLTIGGTFFLGFWPLILIMVASFAALYVYFGPTFVHGASKISASPPPYIDPYTLLEDERISQISP